MIKQDNFEQARNLISCLEPQIDPTFQLTLVADQQPQLKFSKELVILH